MELRDRIGEFLKAYRDERVSYTDAISGILSLPELKEALEARAQHRAWAGDFSKRLGHSISTGTRE
jgi:hypothetical protein